MKNESTEARANYCELAQNTPLHSELEPLRTCLTQIIKDETPNDAEEILLQVLQQPQLYDSEGEDEQNYEDSD